MFTKSGGSPFQRFDGGAQQGGKVLSGRGRGGLLQIGAGLAQALKVQHARAVFEAVRLTPQLGAKFGKRFR